MARTPRALEPFLSALSHGGLVFDGAMGTELHAGGVPYAACMEQLTLDRPGQVRAVHTAYLEAGAQVLGSNTFGANRYRLAPHGLEAQVGAINAAALRMARELATGRAHVAGVVGPTGRPSRGESADQARGLRQAFVAQCRALVDEGADLLLLETFREPEELYLALDAALEAAAGRVPVLASASFDAPGTLADGTTAEALAEALKARGAAALGVNCGTGPDGCHALATRLLPAGLPIVVQPSAGLPQRGGDGSERYPTTPEQFRLHARRLYDAGVKAVGGCCGTTPAHVREIRGSLP